MIDETRYSAQRNEEESFGSDSSDEEDFVEDQETWNTKQKYDEDEESSFENDDENEDDEVALVEREQRAISASGRRKSFVYGKNKYKWCLRAPETRGQRSDTVIQLPGPKSNAVNASSALEIWSLLFTDEIIDMIVQHTNKEVEKEINMNKQSYNRKTTATEIKTIIRLLCFCRCKKKCSCEC